MIKTMNGEKSNFHISAISINPSYKDKEAFNSDVRTIIFTIKP